MKMNPEVKAAWVAALRSGEYKQTKQNLRRSAAHCCLGVLCDLYAKEGGVGWSRPVDLSEAGSFQSYTGVNFPDANLPGATVCIWAQLDPYEKVSLKGTTQTLFDHNDDGCTFAEIADAIEAQL